MFKFFKVFFSCLWICTFLAFFACNTENSSKQIKEQWTSSNGKVKVLSTISMIHDLVENIGGEFVDAIPLIKSELDPHTYQIVKGDDEKLAFADIIFYSGLGLEHGPSLQSFLYGQSKAVGLGDLLMKDQPSLLIYHQGIPDPHIWMDISIWAKTIPYIVNALSAKDPQRAEFFQKNGENLYRNMMQEHQEIKELLQSIPEAKRYLVTSHDAFNYFTRAYLAEEGEIEPWKHRFAAPEGLAPESQISPVDIQFIIDHLQQYDIRVLFPESNVNRDSLKKITLAAKQKGIDVNMVKSPLYGDAMGKPGSAGDTYLKMIRYNAQLMSENLPKNGGIER